MSHHRSISFKLCLIAVAIVPIITIGTNATAIIMSLEDKCDEVVGRGLSASQNAFRIPILIYSTYEDDTHPHIYYIYPYIVHI